MIEKNSVAGMKAIGLPVIDRDPISIKLCHPIGVNGDRME